MKRIIFATGNEGKMREVREILSDLEGFELVSMKEAGIRTDIVEDGTSYTENALIKARAVKDEALRLGMKDFLVMSDDSGFEVDHLGKEPGIYSARYMGEDTSYDIKNAEILRRMEGVAWEDRTARFVCAIAMVGEDGREEAVQATFEGFCAYEIKGEYGFGYDPIFFVPEFGCNDAELLPEVKNRISHRAKALVLAREVLAGWN
ncbi:MAG: RdgB/HAM1 family non-canonical purine NTP pyrophosphatase [Lachnospiraceae bacterium]|nr:RdgB/HAM1 family non-canonical purine NTP pyrophosphatase [Lachnospiraceae bacterium]MBQ6090165.1 RdgB/HAM1 family non-canonical purine NTP pyrophosphatase [Lachnospiraceae bacterium]